MGTTFPKKDSSSNHSCIAILLTLICLDAPSQVTVTPLHSSCPCKTERANRFGEALHAFRAVPNERTKFSSICLTNSAGLNVRFILLLLSYAAYREEMHRLRNCRECGGSHKSLKRQKH